MEADFQREYGINLIEALPTMNWRRFSVLWRGLGPNSVTVCLNSAKNVSESNELGTWTEESGPLGKFKTLTAGDLSGFNVVRAKGGNA